MFTKKTIRDIDVQSKTVIVHGEFDTPLSADGSEVTSDFRLRSCLPTLQYLMQHGCRIILISKVGRPGGKVDPKLSLHPVATCLERLLGKRVDFVPACIGDEVRAGAQKLQPGGLLMLENLRFYPEEEENDMAFARQIVHDTGAQVFVDDCFALAHRSEAGNEAIAHCVPVSVAGFHLEREINTLSNVMQNPKRPVMAIMGGAKISDKLEVMDKFIAMADVVVVGGALANTFLAAKGVDVAKSLIEPDYLEAAKKIIAVADKRVSEGSLIFGLPLDVVVAEELSATSASRVVSLYDQLAAGGSGNALTPNERMLDIGPCTAMYYAGLMQQVSTAIWNGTMGVTEVQSSGGGVGPFAHGTEVIIDALRGKFGNKPFSVIGGGDTTGYIEQRGLVDSFDHVSTGGGASLELMAGRKLPAVAALADK